MCYGNIKIKTQIQVTLSNLSPLEKLDKKFLGIKIKPLTSIFRGQEKQSNFKWLKKIRFSISSIFARLTKVFGLPATARITYKIIQT